MQNKKMVLIVFCIFLIICVVGGTFFLKKEETPGLKERIESPKEIVLNNQAIPKYMSGEISNIKVIDKETAIEALSEQKNLYKMTNVKKEFDVEERKEKDITYYEFQQKYNNIKVLGAKLIMSVDKNGNVLAINGNYLPKITAKTYGLLKEEELKAKLNSLYGEDSKYLEIDKYIEENFDNAIYSVSLLSKKGAYKIIVDALDGRVIEEKDLMEYTNFIYTGKGFNDQEHTINIKEMNALNTNFKGEKAYSFFDEERNIIISDVSGLVNMSLWGIVTEVYVKDPLGANNYKPIIAYMNEEGTLYYPNEQQDKVDTLKSAITAMRYYENIYDFYKNVLGRDSYDNKGSMIRINLNVSQSFFGYTDWHNGAWVTGIDQMFIGNSGSESFTVGEDILAHEFTHGVVSHTAGLDNKPDPQTPKDYESDALNEAYADILGALIENKNWLMGEDVFEGGARDLVNPENKEEPKEVSGKYFYPDYYYNEDKSKIIVGDETYENIGDYDRGGIHHNSTIVGHTAYLMSKNGAFKDNEEMAKVWYNSLFLLSAHANFEDCAYAVIQSATNLGLEKEKVNIIRDAFIETKILSTDFYKLSGQVTDEEEEPLPNVLVTAISEKNAYVYYETYTDKFGKYEFKELPASEYTISFEKAKYFGTEKNITLDESKENIDTSLEKIVEKNSKESEIIFVMDNSYSMEENDSSDIRKQIIANVLESLNNESKVALVTFTANAKVVNNGLKNKNVDRKIIITDIFNMSNDNGTNDESGTNGMAGIEKGLSLFSSNSSVRKYIVFLTDGDDNKTNEKSYDDLISEAKEKDVRILTIGLGDEVNTSNLIKLADETKGKYYLANSSSKLYKFDKRIFDEIN